MEYIRSWTILEDEIHSPECGCELCEQDREIDNVEETILYDKRNDKDF